MQFNAAPLKDALMVTLNGDKTYSTEKSIVELHDPDPKPITEEMGGPRYLFRRTKTDQD